MNQIVTVKESMKVAGPTEKFGIVEYEQAVGLLRQCLTIDDAKRFATFSDAKAAWAKVVHDTAALRLSKALKLHAARHMAELAEKERPGDRKLVLRDKKTGRIKTTIGPKSLLREAGLSNTEAAGAIRLKGLANKQFEQLIKSPRPPTLIGVTTYLNKELDLWAEVGSSLSPFCSLIERITPEDAIDRLSRAPKANKEKIRERFASASEWCLKFLKLLKD